MRSVLPGLLGLLLAAAASPLSAQEYPAFGGQGDASRRDLCEPGEYLVGYGWRGEGFVAEIGLRCASLNNTPNVRTLGDIVLRKSPSGGGRGVFGVTEVVCPKDMFVTRMGFWLTAGNRQVQHVGLRCLHVATGAESFVEFGGPKQGAPQVQNCGDQNAAVGYNIRFGRDVNALGLVCAPYPRGTVTAGPSSPLADNTAICNAHADRMFAMANELKSRQCTLGPLPTYLVKHDRTRFADDCKNRKYRTTEAAAENIRITETQLSTPLAQCKGGGGEGNATKTTTILQDVNLFANPPPLNGEQKADPLPNTLRKGAKVRLFECRTDDWCRVDGGWLTGDGFITR